MAQKRTTLRGWKKPEDGKSSACRLISSFVCIFGGIKWDCSKSLTIDCAEQLTTNPSVPGQGPLHRDPGPWLTGWEDIQRGNREKYPWLSLLPRAASKSRRMSIRIYLQLGPQVWRFLLNQRNIENSPNRLAEGSGMRWFRAAY